MVIPSLCPAEAEPISFIPFLVPCLGEVAAQCEQSSAQPCPAVGGSFPVLCPRGSHRDPAQPGLGVAVPVGSV